MNHEVALLYMEHYSVRCIKEYHRTNRIMNSYIVKRICNFLPLEDEEFHCWGLNLLSFWNDSKDNYLERKKEQGINKDHMSPKYLFCSLSAWNRLLKSTLQYYNDNYINNNIHYIIFCLMLDCNEIVSSIWVLDWVTSCIVGMVKDYDKSGHMIIMDNE